MSLTDDRVRLLHMRDAAQQAMMFVEGESRESLDRDTKLVFALVRAVEIVGEAASRVSPEFREAHPQISWPLMIGMRNRLIHAYYEVNLNTLWETVVESLPPLVAELEKIIAGGA